MKLKAKTPESAAKELGQWLTENGANDVTVRDNEVICEGFTYDWPSALSGGSCPRAWEGGTYSKVGPFPEGLCNDSVFGEPQNHYSVRFYEN